MHIRFYKQDAPTEQYRSKMYLPSTPDSHDKLSLSIHLIINNLTLIIILESFTDIDKYAAIGVFIGV